eukprot:1923046-Prymnesium_polylepis.1
MSHHASSPLLLRRRFAHDLRWGATAPSSCAIFCCMELSCSSTRVFQLGSAASASSSDWSGVTGGSPVNAVTKA